MSFFPFRGPPWTPKPRKTRGFLIASRWNSGTPRGPKHRKTGCFLTPWAEYTVNYKGSGDPEVTPRWPPPGSAAGPARHYNFRLPTEGLRQGHGARGRRPNRRPPARARASGLWGRRPDYRRATAHAADPRFQRNLKQKGFGHFGHLRTRYKQRMNKIFGLLDLIRKRRVAGPAWARIRNSRTPAGFRPNGWPFGLQSRCHLGTFEPAKSKGDLGTLGTL